VSQIVGYILALQITAGLMVGIILISNDTINNSTKDAAEIIAEDIAHVVSDAVLGAVSTRRNIDESSYEFVVDIPRTLVGKPYYVELTDKKVYVNSTDGFITVNCTTYNAEEFNYGISGKAYGSNGRIEVFCNPVEEVYKFDFGTLNSNVADGYIKIVNTSASFITDTWLDGWDYRMSIVLNNSVSEDYRKYGITSLDLDSFSYPIYLKPSYFDYSKTNLSSGIDIRFYDKDDSGLSNSLDYFIEIWNPIGTSKIWVEITGHSPLNMNSKKTIYMYFGNDSAVDIQSDPADFFDFYDDFSDPDESQKKWYDFPENNANFSSNNCLNLSNGSAVYTNDSIFEQNKNDPSIHFQNPVNFTINYTSETDDDFSFEGNGTSNVNIVYNLYRVEAMMRLFPDDAKASTVLGVLMNRPGIVNKFSEIFENSYVTISNSSTLNGYSLGKGYPIEGNAGGMAGGIGGGELLESKDISIPDRWFVQRTGVFIGKTENETYGTFENTSKNPSETEQVHFYNSDNYTIIGNIRFNCTENKKMSSFVSLPQVLDTNESFTNRRDDPGGVPFLSGNMSIGLESFMDSYLLVDWVKVYKTLIYDLNPSFEGLDSNNSYWSNKDKVSSDIDSLNNDIFYDYNNGTEKVEFIVENLPEGDLFVTFGMGSKKIGHSTNIKINNSEGMISTIQASDDPSNYSNCYSFIEKEDNDGTLKFVFSGNWIINTLKIEKGDKGISIKEGV